MNPIAGSSITVPPLPHSGTTTSHSTVRRRCRQLINALALMGGGARAAYQASYTRTYFERTGHRGRKLPFKILTGVSAGSLNALALAMYADDFDKGTQYAVDLWRNIHFENVFVTRHWSLLSHLGSFCRDTATRLVTVNRSKKRENVRGRAFIFQSLLDMSPLRKFLAEKIDFERIRYHLSNGNLRAVGVTAFSYPEAKTVTFFEGVEELEEWTRSGHLGVRATLTPEHALASCALPLFFRPVAIDGKEYCDGGKENKNPLSPAIHLGADRILAIRNSASWHHRYSQGRISFGAILSSLVNSAFSDHVTQDAEHIHALNKGLPEGFRHVDVRIATPSKNLYREGLELAERCLPWGMQIFLRPWGGVKILGPNLSTILFHPEFSRHLIELGRKDASGEDARPLPMSTSGNELVGTDEIEVGLWHLFISGDEIQTVSTEQS